MKLNVTEDLRNKVIKMPTPGEFLPKSEDAEIIDIISLTMKDCNKVKLKAEAARLNFVDSFDGDEDLAERFAIVEYNNTLKYWAVVYALAVDDEPAYKLNGMEQVTSYIDNYFGTTFNPIYEDLAVTICQENGLELQGIEEDDEETEELTELTSVAV